jgi:hypothetical protein
MIKVGNASSHQAEAPACPDQGLSNARLTTRGAILPSALIDDLAPLDPAIGYWLQEEPPLLYRHYWTKE